MQPAQDVSVGARLGRTLYQYTLQDPNQDELNTWAPKILAKMQQIPLLTDVTSDQENAGTTETLTYDRDQAARFGVQPATIDNVLYDAFGQREVAQYFTGNKAYYVILEALPSEYGKLATLRKLYVHVDQAARRCRCPPCCTRPRFRCSRWRSTTRASSRR